MADFNFRDVRTQALDLRAKMYAFLVLPRERTFLKTTERSWTNTILSRGGRRKLFDPSNPGLLNKLTGME